MTKVSVCCPTFNSEKTLRRTLESVKAVADEIIIVDSGSKDSTLAIAREYTDKVFTREYDYHGRQMNHAIGLCSNEWVFCIDSDEEMDQAMAGSIKKLKENGFPGQTAYRLKREWYFFGRPVHAFYPVSSPDSIIRMFDRRTVRFNDRPVHDKPIGFSSWGWIGGRLIHNSSIPLHELFDKMNKYTTRHVKGAASGPSNVTPLHLVANPVFAFLKWYFVKKNFLDGVPGLMLGLYAAIYTYLKYAKLYSVKLEKRSRGE